SKTTLTCSLSCAIVGEAPSAITAATNETNAVRMALLTALAVTVAGFDGAPGRQANSCIDIIAPYLVERWAAVSGKGDAAIKSHALGLLNPGMKRSQKAALTVPYVVAGLWPKPAKYSRIKPSLKFMRGYWATISSRTSTGN